MAVTPGFQIIRELLKSRTSSRRICASALANATKCEIPVRKSSFTCVQQIKKRTARTRTNDSYFLRRYASIVNDDAGAFLSRSLSSGSHRAVHLSRLKNEMQNSYLVSVRDINDLPGCSSAKGSRKDTCEYKKSGSRLKETPGTFHRSDLNANITSSSDSKTSKQPRYLALKSYLKRIKGGYLLQRNIIGQQSRGFATASTKVAVDSKSGLSRWWAKTFAPKSVIPKHKIVYSEKAGKTIREPTGVAKKFTSDQRETNQVTDLMNIKEALSYKNAQVQIDLLILKRAKERMELLPSGWAHKHMLKRMKSNDAYSNIRKTKSCQNLQDPKSKLDKTLYEVIYPKAPTSNVQEVSKNSLLANKLTNAQKKSNMCSTKGHKYCATQCFEREMHIPIANSPPNRNYSSKPPALIYYSELNDSTKRYTIKFTQQPPGKKFSTKDKNDEKNSDTYCQVWQELLKSKGNLDKKLVMSKSKRRNKSGLKLTSGSSRKGSQVQIKNKNASTINAPTTQNVSRFFNESGETKVSKDVNGESKNIRTNFQSTDQKPTVDSAPLKSNFKESPFQKPFKNSSVGGNKTHIRKKRLVSSAYVKSTARNTVTMKNATQQYSNPIQDGSVIQKPENYLNVQNLNKDNRNNMAKPLDEPKSILKKWSLLNNKTPLNLQEHISELMPATAQKDDKFKRATTDISKKDSVDYSQRESVSAVKITPIVLPEHEKQKQLTSILMTKNDSRKSINPELSASALNKMSLDESEKNKSTNNKGKDSLGNFKHRLRKISNVVLKKTISQAQNILKVGDVKPRLTKSASDLLKTINEKSPGKIFPTNEKSNAAPKTSKTEVQETKIEASKCKISPIKNNVPGSHVAPLPIQKEISGKLKKSSNDLTVHNRKMHLEKYNSISEPVKHQNFANQPMQKRLLSKNSHLINNIDVVTSASSTEGKKKTSKTRFDLKVNSEQEPMVEPSKKLEILSQTDAKKLFTSKNNLESPIYTEVLETTFKPNKIPSLSSFIKPINVKSEIIDKTKELHGKSAHKTVLERGQSIKRTLDILKLNSKIKMHKSFRKPMQIKNIKERITPSVLIINGQNIQQPQRDTNNTTTTVQAKRVEDTGSNLHDENGKTSINLKESRMINVLKTNSHAENMSDRQMHAEKLPEKLNKSELKYPQQTYRNIKTKPKSNHSRIQSILSTKNSKSNLTNKNKAVPNSETLKPVPKTPKRLEKRETKNTLSNSKRLGENITREKKYQKVIENVSLKKTTKRSKSSQVYSEKRTPDFLKDLIQKIRLGRKVIPSGRFNVTYGPRVKRGPQLDYSVPREVDVNLKTKSDVQKLLIYNKHRVPKRPKENNPKESPSQSSKQNIATYNNKSSCLENIVKGSSRKIEKRSSTDKTTPEPMYANEIAGTSKSQEISSHNNKYTDNTNRIEKCKANLIPIKTNDSSDSLMVPKTQAQVKQDCVDDSAQSASEVVTAQTEQVDYVDNSAHNVSEVKLVANQVDCVGSSAVNASELEAPVKQVDNVENSAQNVAEVNSQAKQVDYVDDSLQNVSNIQAQTTQVDCVDNSAHNVSEVTEAKQVDCNDNSAQNVAEVNSQAKQVDYVDDSLQNVSNIQAQITQVDCVDNSAHNVSEMKPEANQVECIDNSAHSVFNTKTQTEHDTDPVRETAQNVSKVNEQSKLVDYANDSANCVSEVKVPTKQVTCVDNSACNLSEVKARTKPVGCVDDSICNISEVNTSAKKVDNIGLCASKGRTKHVDHSVWNEQVKSRRKRLDYSVTSAAKKFESNARTNRIDYENTTAAKKPKSKLQIKREDYAIRSAVKRLEVRARTKHGNYIVSSLIHEPKEKSRAKPLDFTSAKKDEGDAGIKQLNFLGASAKKPNAKTQTKHLGKSDISLEKPIELVDYVETSAGKKPEVKTRTEQLDYVETYAAKESKAGTENGDYVETAEVEKPAVKARTEHEDSTKTSVSQQPEVKALTEHVDYVESSAANQTEVNAQTQHADYTETTAVEEHEVKARREHVDYIEKSAANKPEVNARAEHAHYTETSAAEDPVIEARTEHVEYTDISVAKEPEVKAGTEHVDYIENSAANKPEVNARVEHAHYTETSAAEEPEIEARTENVEYTEISAAKEPEVKGGTEYVDCIESSAANKPEVNSRAEHAVYTETSAAKEPEVKAQTENVDYIETSAVEEPEVKARTEHVEEYTEISATKAPEVKARIEHVDYIEPSAEKEPEENVRTDNVSYTETSAAKEPEVEAGAEHVIYIESCVANKIQVNDGIEHADNTENSSAEEPEIKSRTEHVDYTEISPAKAPEVNLQKEHVDYTEPSAVKEHVVKIRAEHVDYAETSSAMGPEVKTHTDQMEHVEISEMKKLNTNFRTDSLDCTETPAAKEPIVKEIVQHCLNNKRNREAAVADDELSSTSFKNALTGISSEVPIEEIPKKENLERLQEKSMSTPISSEYRDKELTSETEVVINNRLGDCFLPPKTLKSIMTLAFMQRKHPLTLQKENTLSSFKSQSLIAETESIGVDNELSNKPNPPTLPEAPLSRSKDAVAKKENISKIKTNRVSFAEIVKLKLLYEMALKQLELRKTSYKTTAESTTKSRSESQHFHEPSTVTEVRDNESVARDNSDEMVTNNNILHIAPKRSLSEIKEYFVPFQLKKTKEKIPKPNNLYEIIAPAEIKDVHNFKHYNYEYNSTIKQGKSQLPLAFMYKKQSTSLIPPKSSSESRIFRSLHNKRNTPTDERPSASADNLMEEDDIKTSGERCAGNSEFKINDKTISKDTAAENRFENTTTQGSHYTRGPIVNKPSLCSLDIKLISNKKAQILPDSISKLPHSTVSMLNINEKLSVRIEVPDELVKGVEIKKKSLDKENLSVPVQTDTNVSIDQKKHNQISSELNAANSCQQRVENSADSCHIRIEIAAEKTKAITKNFPTFKDHVGSNRNLGTTATMLKNEDTKNEAEKNEHNAVTSKHISNNLKQVLSMQSDNTVSISQTDMNTGTPFVIEDMTKTKKEAESTPTDITKEITSAAEPHDRFDKETVAATPMEPYKRSDQDTVAATPIESYKRSDQDTVAATPIEPHKPSDNERVVVESNSYMEALAATPIDLHKCWLTDMETVVEKPTEPYKRLNKETDTAAPIEPRKRSDKDTVASTPIEPYNRSDQEILADAPIEPHECLDKEIFATAPIEPHECLDKEIVAAAPIESHECLDKEIVATAPIELHNGSDNETVAAAPIELHNGSDNETVAAAPIEPHECLDKEIVAAAPIELHNGSDNETVAAAPIEPHECLDKEIVATAPIEPHECLDKEIVAAAPIEPHECLDKEIVATAPIEPHECLDKEIVATAPIELHKGSDNEIVATAPIEPHECLDKEIVAAAPIEPHECLDKEIVATAPIELHKGSDNEQVSTAPIELHKGSDNEIVAAALIEPQESLDKEMAATAPVELHKGSDNETAATAPIELQKGSDNEIVEAAPVELHTGSDNETVSTAPIELQKGSDNEIVAAAPIEPHDCPDKEISATAPVELHKSSDNETVATAPIELQKGSDNEIVAAAPIEPHECLDKEIVATAPTELHKDSDNEIVAAAPIEPHECLDKEIAATAPVELHKSSDNETVATAPIELQKGSDNEIVAAAPIETYMHSDKETFLVTPIEPHVHSDKKTSASFESHKRSDKDTVEAAPIEPHKRSDKETVAATSFRPQEMETMDTEKDANELNLSLQSQSEISVNDDKLPKNILANDSTARSVIIGLSNPKHIERTISFDSSYADSKDSPGSAKDRLSETPVQKSDSFKTMKRDQKSLKSFGSNRNEIEKKPIVTMNEKKSAVDETVKAKNLDEIKKVDIIIPDTKENETCQVRIDNRDKQYWPPRKYYSIDNLDHGENVNKISNAKKDKSKKILSKKPLNLKEYLNIKQKIYSHNQNEDVPNEKETTNPLKFSNKTENAHSQALDTTEIPKSEETLSNKNVQVFNKDISKTSSKSEEKALQEVDRPLNGNLGIENDSRPFVSTDKRIWKIQGTISMKSALEQFSKVVKELKLEEQRQDIVKDEPPKLQIKHPESQDCTFKNEETLKDEVGKEEQRSLPETKGIDVKSNIINAEVNQNLNPNTSLEESKPTTRLDDKDGEPIGHNKSLEINDPTSNLIKGDTESPKAQSVDVETLAKKIMGQLRKTNEQEHTVRAIDPVHIGVENAARKIVDIISLKLKENEEKSPLAIASKRVYSPIQPTLPPPQQPPKPKKRDDIPKRDKKKKFVPPPYSPNPPAEFQSARSSIVEQSSPTERGTEQRGQRQIEEECVEPIKNAADSKVVERETVESKIENLAEDKTSENTLSTKLLWTQYKLNILPNLGKEKDSQTERTDASGEDTSSSSVQKTEASEQEKRSIDRSARISIDKTESAVASGEDTRSSSIQKTEASEQEKRSIDRSARISIDKTESAVASGYDTSSSVQKTEASKQEKSSIDRSARISIDKTESAVASGYDTSSSVQKTEASKQEKSSIDRSARISIDKTESAVASGDDTSSSVQKADASEQDTSSIDRSARISINKTESAVASGDDTSSSVQKTEAFEQETSSIDQSALTSENFNSEYQDNKTNFNIYPKCPKIRLRYYGPISITEGIRKRLTESSNRAVKERSTKGSTHKNHHAMKSKDRLYKTPRTEVSGKQISNNDERFKRSEFKTTTETTLTEPQLKKEHIKITSNDDLINIIKASRKGSNNGSNDPSGLSSIGNGRKPENLDDNLKSGNSNRFNQTRSKASRSLTPKPSCHKNDLLLEAKPETNDESFGCLLKIPDTSSNAEIEKLKSNKSSPRLNSRETHNDNQDSTRLATSIMESQQPFGRSSLFSVTPLTKQEISATLSDCNAQESSQAARQLEPTVASMALVASINENKSNKSTDANKNSQSAFKMETAVGKSESPQLSFKTSAVEKYNSGTIKSAEDDHPQKSETLCEPGKSKDFKDDTLSKLKSTKSTDGSIGSPQSSCQKAATENSTMYVYVGKATLKIKEAEAVSTQFSNPKSKTICEPVKSKDGKEAPEPSKSGKDALPQKSKTNETDKSINYRKALGAACTYTKPLYTKSAEASIKSPKSSHTKEKSDQSSSKSVEASIKSPKSSHTKEKSDQSSSKSAEASIKSPKSSHTKEKSHQSSSKSAEASIKSPKSSHTKEKSHQSSSKSAEASIKSPKSSHTKEKSDQPSSKTADDETGPAQSTIQKSKTLREVVKSNDGKAAPEPTKIAKDARPQKSETHETAKSDGYRKAIEQSCTYCKPLYTKSAESSMQSPKSSHKSAIEKSDKSSKTADSEAGSTQSSIQKPKSSLKSDKPTETKKAPSFFSKLLRRKSAEILIPQSTCQKSAIPKTDSTNNETSSTKSIEKSNKSETLCESAKSKDLKKSKKPACTFHKPSTEPEEHVQHSIKLDSNEIPEQPRAVLPDNIKEQCSGTNISDPCKATQEESDSSVSKQGSNKSEGSSDSKPLSSESTTGKYKKSTSKSEKAETVATQSSIQKSKTLESGEPKDVKETPTPTKSAKDARPQKSETHQTAKSDGYRKALEQSCTYCKPLYTKSAESSMQSPKSSHKSAIEKSDKSSKTADSETGSTQSSIQKPKTSLESVKPADAKKTPSFFPKLSRTKSAEALIPQSTCQKSAVQKSDSTNSETSGTKSIEKSNTSEISCESAKSKDLTITAEDSKESAQSSKKSFTKKSRKSSDSNSEMTPSECVEDSYIWTSETRKPRGLKKSKKPGCTLFKPLLTNTAEDSIPSEQSSRKSEKDTRRRSSSTNEASNEDICKVESSLKQTENNIVSNNKRDNQQSSTEVKGTGQSMQSDSNDIPEQPTAVLPDNIKEQCSGTNISDPCKATQEGSDSSISKQASNKREGSSDSKPLPTEDTTGKYNKLTSKSEETKTTSTNIKTLESGKPKDVKETPITTKSAKDARPQKSDTHENAKSDGYRKALEQSCTYCTPLYTKSAKSSMQSPNSSHKSAIEKSDKSSKTADSETGSTQSSIQKSKTSSESEKPTDDKKTPSILFIPQSTGQKSAIQKSDATNSETVTKLIENSSSQKSETTCESAKSKDLKKSKKPACTFYKPSTNLDEKELHSKQSESTEIPEQPRAVLPDNILKQCSETNLSTPGKTTQTGLESAQSTPKSVEKSVEKSVDPQKSETASESTKSKNWKNSKPVCTFTCSPAKTAEASLVNKSDLEESPKYSKSAEAAIIPTQSSIKKSSNLQSSCELVKSNDVKEAQNHSKQSPMRLPEASIGSPKPSCHKSDISIETSPSKCVEDVVSQKFQTSNESAKSKDLKQSRKPLCTFSKPSSKTAIEADKELEQSHQKSASSTETPTNDLESSYQKSVICSPIITRPGPDTEIRADDKTDICSPIMTSPGPDTKIGAEDKTDICSPIMTSPGPDTEIRAEDKTDICSPIITRIGPDTEKRADDKTDICSPIITRPDPDAEIRADDKTDICSPIFTRPAPDAEIRADDKTDICSPIITRPDPDAEIRADDKTDICSPISTRPSPDAEILAEDKTDICSPISTRPNPDAEIRADDKTDICSPKIIRPSLETEIRGEDKTDICSPIITRPNPDAEIRADDKTDMCSPKITRPSLETEIRGEDKTDICSPISTRPSPDTEIRAEDKTDICSPIITRLNPETEIRAEDKPEICSPISTRPSLETEIRGEDKTEICLPISTRPSPDTEIRSEDKTDICSPISTRPSPDTEIRSEDKTDICSPIITRPGPDTEIRTEDKTDICSTIGTRPSPHTEIRAEDKTDICSPISTRPSPDTEIRAEDKTDICSPIITRPGPDTEIRTEDKTDICSPIITRLNPETEICTEDKTDICSPISTRPSPDTETLAEDKQVISEERHSKKNKYSNVCQKLANPPEDTHKLESNESIAKDRPSTGTSIIAARLRTTIKDQSSSNDGPDRVLKLDSTQVIPHRDDVCGSESSSNRIQTESDSPKVELDSETPESVEKLKKSSPTEIKVKTASSYKTNEEISSSNIHLKKIATILQDICHELAHSSKDKAIESESPKLKAEESKTLPKFEASEESATESSSNVKVLSQPTSQVRKENDIEPEKIPAKQEVHLELEFSSEDTEVPRDKPPTDSSVNEARLRTSKDESHLNKSAKHTSKQDPRQLSPHGDITCELEPSISYKNKDTRASKDNRRYSNVPRERALKLDLRQLNLPGVGISELESKSKTVPKDIQKISSSNEYPNHDLKLDPRQLSPHGVDICKLESSSSTEIPEQPRAVLPDNIKKQCSQTNLSAPCKTTQAGLDANIISSKQRSTTSFSNGTVLSNVNNEVEVANVSCPPRFRPKPCFNVNIKKGGPPTLVIRLNSSETKIHTRLPPINKSQTRKYSSKGETKTTPEQLSSSTTTGIPEQPANTNSNVKTSDDKPSDFKAYDVKASDVKASDVKASDVKASDVKTSDVKTSDVKLSDQTPKVGTIEPITESKLIKPDIDIATYKRKKVCAKDIENDNPTRPHLQIPTFSPINWSLSSATPLQESNVIEKPCPSTCKMDPCFTSGVCLEEKVCKTPVCVTDKVRSNQDKPKSMCGKPDPCLVLWNPCNNPDLISVPQPETNPKSWKDCMKTVDPDYKRINRKPCPERETEQQQIVKKVGSPCNTDSNKSAKSIFWNLLEKKDKK